RELSNDWRPPSLFKSFADPILLVTLETVSGFATSVLATPGAKDGMRMIVAAFARFERGSPQACDVGLARIRGLCFAMSAETKIRSWLIIIRYPACPCIPLRI